MLEEPPCTRCTKCDGRGKITKSITTQTNNGGWKSEYKEVVCTVCVGAGIIVHGKP